MKPMIRYRRDLWRVLEGVPGDAAELGVAEGYFSAEMLGWPVNLPKVYMVDRWYCMPHQRGDGGHPQNWHDKNLEAALKRVEPFGIRARVLRGDTAEMAAQVPDKSLALVYVDADHSYEGVLRDACAWLPKLVKGGVMAFHDYEAPQYGVKKAVAALCNERGFALHFLPEDKPDDAGAYFYVDSV